MIKRHHNTNVKTKNTHKNKNKKREEKDDIRQKQNETKQHRHTCMQTNQSMYATLQFIPKKFISLSLSKKYNYITIALRALKSNKQIKTDKRRKQNQKHQSTIVR